MDGHHFDALAKRLSSRRTALGGLVASLLLPLEISARGQGKGKDKDKQRKHGGKGKGRDKKRTHAQAEQCWRAGACIPGKGSNVSRCDLSGISNLPLDSTGSNLSRANLRGVNARGVNFTKANLSGACLIDADFTGATFANNTNLANAIFCNTKMPDGSPNNSGCGAGTACCPTCVAAGGRCGVGFGACCGSAGCFTGICCVPTTCEELGKQCGSWPDGCGGTLQCGACGTGATPACNNGICASCTAMCGASCFCANLIDGSTQCWSRGSSTCATCTLDSPDCGARTCVSTATNGATNVSFSAPEIYCQISAPGVCMSLTSCGAG